MRKIFITFLVLLTFSLLALSSSKDENYYSQSYAHLSYVKGDVFIQRASDGGYEEGVVNLPIVAGDTLGTRKGRTEIYFDNRNYLRVDYDTQVEIVKLPQRSDDLIKLHVLSGSIYLSVNFLEREKSFEIHTPDVSFYILEEGLYRLDVRKKGETELLVYKGAVEAAGEEGSLLVESDQRLVASDGNFLSRPTFFIASLDDDFAEWNEYRDSLLNARVTKTYLPSELYEYEAELASNGRWVYEQPYGYVWVPHVYDYEWRPFFYGKWVWYPIIGWTWVSYDPWGWCVYRYGRWHWRLGLGWYWIPTRIWGPAWVYWHWGYDYIGWCPISYYGYPVVIVNNIFYGRYYSRSYPYNSRALVVVHKNQLQAPHVSKAALKQSRIKLIGKINLSDKQLGVKPVVNKITKNSVSAKVLSRSSIKKYSSSLTTSSSQLNKLSSSKQRKPLKSESVQSYPRKVTPSKIIPSRPRIKSYTPSSSSSFLRSTSKRSSSTYPSKDNISRTRKEESSFELNRFRSSSYSSNKYSSSQNKSFSSRYVSPRQAPSSSKSYSSPKYSSPSRSYQAQRSSYSQKGSSSKYVSPRSTPSSKSHSSRSALSSSRSSVSRSSSRSSSSSSSRGIVKKK